MATSPNITATHLDANTSQPEVVINASLDLLDEVVAGILVHNLTSDADYTLSTATDPEEWQYAEVNITDTTVFLTTARNIIVPTNKKVYIFRNNTAQDLTIKTSAGTGIAVAAGAVDMARCDGTDVVRVAPVSSGIADLVDDTTPQLGGDLDCNGNQVQWSKGADVASATALPVLTDGNYFDVTGAATVTSIDTTAVGTLIKLHFDGAVPLTHHATDLIMPNSANYTTAAGDEFEFIEYATGDYRCTGYVLANGQSIVGASGALDIPVIAKTAAYTVTTGDAGKLIDCDATSAAFTVTLPVAATAGDGFTITVKKTDSTANVVTVDGDTAETLDGAATKALSAQYDTIQAVCDGTDWHLTIKVGSGTTDADAIHDNVAAEISALTDKTTPVSGDWLIMEDSAAGNAKKKVSIGNLPTGGGSTLPVTDTTSIVEGSVDGTKELRMEVDGLTTATVRVWTVQDIDLTVAGYDVNQTFTKAQRGSTTALTDGATITPDMDDNNFFSVTLAGNRTLANPTNLTVDQSGSIYITQDATGTRTLAYGSQWDFAGAITPALSTAASTVDRLDYVVRTTGSIHAQLTRAWA